MGIYNVFIVSKSGGLIYHHDRPESASHAPYEVEKTFSYPLEVRLRSEPNRVAVDFGGRDGVRVGHSLMAANGVAVGGGGRMDNGEDVFKYLEDRSHYPVSLKFGRPRVTTNEKIVLASMFYPLYALAVQLSPDTGSSGIQELETDTFRLYCSQTPTGVKFLVVADPKQAGIDQLLDKIYELYADYALKNPFYSLEMPIRADLFDQHLQVAIDQIERTGFI